jgi:hypothetical protein
MTVEQIAKEENSLENAQMLILDLPSQPHESPSLAAKGVKQYRYTIMTEVEKERRGSQVQCEVEQDVQEVSDFDQMAKALVGSQPGSSADPKKKAVPKAAPQLKEDATEEEKKAHEELMEKVNFLKEMAKVEGNLQAEKKKAWEAFFQQQSMSTKEGKEYLKPMVDMWEKACKELDDMHKSLTKAKASEKSLEDPPPFWSRIA